ncbi:hypothetical protein Tco_1466849 [Tanacetum coccineum]
MVPRAVLMKSGLVSLNTARQVNTAHLKITMNSAIPMTNLSKSAHLTVKPKEVVNAARPKAVVNVVKANHVNVVKASACWVWKPKTKGNPQIDLHDQGVIDNGCSRHMIENMSYLTDFEEINGGYVAFGGNPKGGKITGRGDVIEVLECLLKVLGYLKWVEMKEKGYQLLLLRLLEWLSVVASIGDSVGVGGVFFYHHTFVCDHYSILFPSILLGPVVKFVFYFLDFSSRAILIGQEPFQFGPGDPIGLFSSNRFGYRHSPKKRRHRLEYQYQIAAAIHQLSVAEMATWSIDGVLDVDVLLGGIY